MKLTNIIALLSVQHGDGPFAAVVVQIDDKTHQVIRYWTEHNHVRAWHDPTAHAEISALRAASQQLGTSNLGHINRQHAKLPQPHEWSHCVIYNSAEPCPMCLSAIYWAGIKRLVFSASRFDSAMPGVNFADEMLYRELARPPAQRQHMQVYRQLTSHTLAAFNYYKRQPHRHLGVVK